ncbi:hypothetical protein PF005_g3856 [Phytophthora fragariae]|uniref:Uncharacterized protein n=1 Tax=Phytophthora fragariae TaxID=53985 RepID=A0A6A3MKV9_9STRA|nr:hypothetical protein PF003_g2409 [Phytophthora fragariae]KAE8946321.1 hypothetical protein PF009_g4024 [Phytophthora fragariae]KAE9030298.1 hypothetical protein PF011_g699 [Phytophthora fragariae]KAE9128792.1 hypothetical protein PF010_g4358 [Phytophthora fragariae]KAE9132056.1 hypothetical protein PF007_g3857 [Phytophthora fragariae]
MLSFLLPSGWLSSLAGTGISSSSREIGSRLDSSSGRVASCSSWRSTSIPSALKRSFPSINPSSSTSVMSTSHNSIGLTGPAAV